MSTMTNHRITIKGLRMMWHLHLLDRKDCAILFIISCKTVWRCTRIKNTQHLCGFHVFGKHPLDCFQGNLVPLYLTSGTNGGFHRPTDDFPCFGSESSLPFPHPSITSIRYLRLQNDSFITCYHVMDYVGTRHGRQALF